MKTYWISFAGVEGNRGIVIIDAKNESAAIKKTHKLGINPGGEAMLLDCTGNPGMETEISRWGRNRLVTKAELVAEDYKSTRQLEAAGITGITLDPRVSFVCDKHN